MLGCCCRVLDRDLRFAADGTGIAADMPGLSCVASTGVDTAGGVGSGCGGAAAEAAVVATRTVDADSRVGDAETEMVGSETGGGAVTKDGDEDEEEEEGGGGG